MSDIVSEILTIARRAIPRHVKDGLLYCFSRRYRRYRMILGLLRKQNGNRVASGPFKGLEYVEKAYGSQLFPKLLGTYEKELHPIIEHIFGRTYEKFINIGAGEGYYAVGVAMRMPSTLVVCFERHRASQRLLKKVAKKNRVSDQIHLIGCCTPRLLSQVLPPARDTHILIICDVEGAEIELLQPLTVPGLSSADILVELHGTAISEEIRRRFESTHIITCILSQPRTLKDWPPQVIVDEQYRAECLSEYRGQSEWFWMVPKREDDQLTSQ